MTPLLAAVNITVKDYLFTLVPWNHEHVTHKAHTGHKHVTYPALNA